MTKVRVAKWLIPGMLIYDMIANKQWFIDIFQGWENARVANIEVQSRVGFDMAPAQNSYLLLHRGLAKFSKSSNTLSYTYLETTASIF
jgi:hypothetical protein